LAESTTETVTAQPMNIQAGTNIVQITQASMDGLELEVKYKAGVAVTITEVQNAQLDDNVEVTING
jgi:ABC-type proline/glycine betaine transport system substrate-binding protein